MTSHLKSLELHGYKTFASQTLFEFSPQITAIVGPNGSGKSNVADSLRWALGEQAYSLLRGRKTEDMIFSGSEHRTRSGMASVNILFSNEDNWLPIDYSEVAITRRAFRDGQNEYLLNGQKVRLKEISELLAQSGLAERTYTIIGQGLVDAALSLKPEERRRFFEEAAGIGLYRHRREDAINRLDATRRNLERVLDILSEIEPRMQSLEKQAKRVQEYQRIQADLQLLLREWYGYHWHRTQRDVSHAQEVYRAQQTRLSLARQRLTDAEVVLSTQHASIQEQRGVLNSWHARLSELHRQHEQISRSLAVLEERMNSQLAQKQNLQSEMGRREEENKAYQDRLQTANEEMERLKTEMAEAQVQAEKARRTLQQRQVERGEVERELRDTRRELVSSETRQVQMKAKLDELANRQDSQRKNQQNLTQTLENENKTLAEAQKHLEQLARQHEEAKQEVKRMEQEIEAHRSQLAGLETEQKRAQDEQSNLKVERSRLQAQLGVLEQAEKSLSGLNQGARFILQAASGGKLKGKYRAINSELEVPAEYESAIAAVLGEYLDGVLLDPDVDAEEALALLEQGEKGRAVFLPSQSPGAAHRLPQFPDGDGVLGCAAELVRAPDHLRSLVSLLLNKTLVVRDRQSARALMGHLQPDTCLVTLKGEIFWPSGVVVAGQDGRQGLIARPRQKRELQEALQDLQQKFDQATRRIETQSQQLNAQRNAGSELDKTLRQSNQKLNQAAQAQQRASMEMEQARQRFEWQRNQMNSLEDQIRRAGDEARKINDALKTIEDEIADYKEQIRQHNRTLGLMPLEELQAQEVNWNTRNAVAARALRDAEKRLEEYRQQLEGNIQQRRDIEKRMSDMEGAFQQHENEKGSLREQELRLDQAIEELQRQIVPTEQELKSLEENYNRQQGDFTAAQQASAAAERNETQSQLELSRHREAVESLRRRIQDDFGLVAFEYVTDVSGPTPLPLEGMVEQLPMIKELSPGIEEGINRQRGQLRRMGAINPDAQKEYVEVRERYEFLTAQVEDLKKADLDLRQVIGELDELMKREFTRTFNAVAAEFRQLFSTLFGGGSARLILTDSESPTEAGIDIEARLPGRREQGLALLSGGERSLTAVALVFSLLKVSPTPFCVLDEVDAMLDESNVGRFCDLLKELSQNTQFVVITHNRSTVQTASVIYGVTMGRDSSSQVISLKLDEVEEQLMQYHTD